MHVDGKLLRTMYICTVGQQKKERNRTGAPNLSSTTSCSSHQATNVHQHVPLPSPQGCGPVSCYHLHLPPWLGTRWRILGDKKEEWGDWDASGCVAVRSPFLFPSCGWSCSYLNASGEHQKNKTAAIDMHNMTSTNMPQRWRPRVWPIDNDIDTDEYSQRQQ